MASDEEAFNDYAKKLAAELNARDARDKELRAALAAEFAKDLSDDNLSPEKIREKFAKMLTKAVLTLDELMSPDMKENTRFNAAKYVTDVLLADKASTDPAEGLKKLLASLGKEA
jgi:hypothetical protein